VQNFVVDFKIDWTLGGSVLSFIDCLATECLYQ